MNMIQRNYIIPRQFLIRRIENDFLITLKTFEFEDVTTIEDF